MAVLAGPERWCQIKLIFQSNHHQQSNEYILTKSWAYIASSLCLYVCIVQNTVPELTTIIIVFVIFQYWFDFDYYSSSRMLMYKHYYAIIWDVHIIQIW